MKNKLSEWIFRHPVTAFFIITFAITWTGVILVLFIFPENQLLQFFGQWALFGPALAAMIVAGIEQPAPKQKSRRSRLLAFLVSWLISALALIIYGVKFYGMDLITSLIANSILALMPAWVLSCAYARTPGVRNQFSTLLRPRGPAVWYLVIFLIFPGLPLLVMGITRLLGGDLQFSMDAASIGDAVILLLLEFLHVFLLTGGINEETGWRGFALPRLQARYPVIISAAIVWIFWAVWHIPLDIGQGGPLSETLVRRLIGNLLVAILFAWSYNRTNGSILAPVLFHTVMNTFENLVHVTGSQAQYYTTILFVLEALVVVLVIVADRMWKKLPEGSPAAFRTIAEAPGAALEATSQ